MNKNLEDLHSDDFDDNEFYDDAAMLQAQRDMMEDNGPKGSKDNESLQERRLRLARGVKEDIEDKWDKFKM